MGEYAAKMHHSLSNHSTKYLTTFQFTESAFKAYQQDGDELLFNNQVYDIVSIENENDQVIIKCELDKDETFFVTLLHSNSTAIENMKSPKQIVHLLHYLSLVSCSQFQRFQFCLSKKEQCMFEHTNFHKSFSLDLITPPPQV